MRKERLITGEYYHVYNKSIEGYKIFLSDKEYHRMLALIQYYQISGDKFKFSRFIKLVSNDQELKIKLLQHSQGKTKLVRIVSYCIMPTHIHFILQQKEDEGISTFMSNILKSYAKYFNIKQNRKGHLWQGPFGAKRIKNDEHLLYLTRYVHLNPTKINLVKKPDKWEYSSYKEFLEHTKKEERFCEYKDILNMSRFKYKKYIEDKTVYHNDQELIKDEIFD